MKPGDERRTQACVCGGRMVINDAVAFIRGRAQHHGRNAEWAERAAVSLTAEEALDLSCLQNLLRRQRT